MWAWSALRNPGLCRAWGSPSQGGHWDAHQPQLGSSKLIQVLLQGSCLCVLRPVDALTWPCPPRAGWDASHLIPWVAQLWLPLSSVGSWWHWWHSLIILYFRPQTVFASHSWFLSHLYSASSWNERSCFSALANVWRLVLISAFWSSL